MTNNERPPQFTWLFASSAAEESLATQRRLTDRLEQQLTAHQERIGQLEQQASAQQQRFDGLVLDLLGVADSLHALDDHFAELERRGERVPRKSVDVALRKLLGVLKKHRVEPMQCTGLPLDLDHHEVVEVKHVRDTPDDIVLEESVRGYLSADRVLRYAKVVVSRNEAVAPSAKPSTKRGTRRSRAKRASSRRSKELTSS